MAYQFTQTGAEIQAILDQVGENTTDISVINTTLTNINTTSSDTSGSVSLASADAWSVVKTINVPAGKYLFIASVVFPSNATGYRAVGISGVSNPSGLYTRDITSVPAANGFNTSITTTRVITLSAQSDIYIVARQNSGAAQTVYPSIIAVRLR